MNKTISKVAAIGFVAVVGAVGLTACTSQADTASNNLSTAAEQFEVNRRITAINGITDAVMLEVEGRCSVETSESMLAGGLEITCKIGPNEYVKHFVGLSDNVSYVVQQLDTTDVSVYHHRVLLKPENLLPEFTYDVGQQ